MKKRLRRKPLSAKRKRRRTPTKKDSDRVYGCRSSNACRTGFQSKGYNGDIPTIGEVPKMKIISDKRAKESSGSFYSYTANASFEIAVALACFT